MLQGVCQLCEVNLCVLNWRRSNARHAKQRSFALLSLTAFRSKLRIDNLPAPGRTAPHDLPILPPPGPGLNDCFGSESDIRQGIAAVRQEMVRLGQTTASGQERTLAEGPTSSALA